MTTGEPANKLDILQDKKRFEAGMRKIMDSKLISEENKKDFEKFILSKRVKTKVSYGKLTGYCSTFINFTTKFFINKRILDLNEDDYLQLCANLEDGIFKTNIGNRYGNGTIESFKMFFKAYMNLMLGRFETEKRFDRLEIKRSKINIRAKYLKFEEIKQVINNIPFEDQEMKFIISFMFSTGCRSQDVRNLRIKDIYYDKEGDLMVALPELKTFGRDIELVLFGSEIKYYLDYVVKEKKRKDEDYLVSYKNGKPVTIQTINRNLKKYFTKILGKEFEWISSHKLRHSSSVYFASGMGMNYTEYCNKFGWSVKSSTPERYFNKNTLGKTKFKKFAEKDEIQKYEFENKELKESVNDLRNSKLKQEKQINDLENNVNKIHDLLYLEKTKKLTIEHHKQRLSFKNSKDFSDLIIPKGLNYEDLENLNKKSHFFNAFNRWKKDIEKYINIEITDKKIIIHAKAIIYQKMYNSFNKEILDELKKIGVNNIKNFEIFMIQILTRSVVINERANNEIDKEMEKI